MNVNDQLKAKIDEIDVDAKIAQLTETASALLATVKEQAASLVGENRAKVDEVIEKATAVLDEKTEGKYHDKVEKAKASFASGLDRLSESRGESGSSFEESAMHAGAEPTSAPDEPLPASTVRPESAWETTDSVASGDTLSESAAEPHDPQAWANETDKTS
jgi:cell division septum initiation protein DivIVA